MSLQATAQEDPSESDPLLRHDVTVEYSNINHSHNPPSLVVYKRRWYILILFSLLGFSQNVIWNTWGPLADSAHTAFNWTEKDLALLANWGCIAFIPSAPFWSWVMDSFGLRVACLITAACMVVGSALRCITSTPPAAVYLIHTGQILNGLAGPVLMAAPPLLSATWFPVSERTRATAMAIMIPGCGLAMSYIGGPLIVPDRSNHSDIHVNGTTLPPTNPTNVDEVRADIMKLMYIECGMVVFVSLAMLLYFPRKPPLPPSITASVQRVDFKQGVLTLVKSRRFWLLAGSYGLSTGVYGCWSTLLNSNLQPLNISQTEGGWMGFSGTLAGFVACVLVSIFADIFSRRLKKFLICLYSIGAICFLVFTLEVYKILPYNRASLWAAYILGSICIVGGIPLIFELICEAAYPVAEGVTNVFTTTLNNLAGFIFFIMFYFPIGSLWANWANVAACAVCIPVFLLYKERYNRMDVDQQVTPHTD